jgi:hypothetical protein
VDADTRGAHGRVGTSGEDFIIRHPTLVVMMMMMMMVHSSSFLETV